MVHCCQSIASKAHIETLHYSLIDEAARALHVIWTQESPSSELPWDSNINYISLAGELQGYFS